MSLSLFPLFVVLAPPPLSPLLPLVALRPLGLPPALASVSRPAASLLFPAALLRERCPDPTVPSLHARPAYASRLALQARVATRCSVARDPSGSPRAQMSNRCLAEHGRKEAGEPHRMHCAGTRWRETLPRLGRDARTARGGGRRHGHPRQNPRRRHDASSKSDPGASGEPRSVGTLRSSDVDRRGAS